MQCNAMPWSAGVDLPAQANFLRCARMKSFCFNSCNEVGFLDETVRDFLPDGGIVFGFG